MKYPKLTYKEKLAAIERIEIMLAHLRNSIAEPSEEWWRIEEMNKLWAQIVKEDRYDWKTGKIR